MTVRVAFLSGLIACAVAAPAAAQTVPPPISVFVFTVAPYINPSPAEHERQLLVEAIKKRLPDNKQMALQVAVEDTREKATVTLEVVNATEQDREMPTGNLVEVMILPLYTAGAKLTFGSYTTDFPAHETEASYTRVVNSGRFNTPTSMADAVSNLLRIKAAQDIAKGVQDWIALNQADLRTQHDAKP